MTLFRPLLTQLGAILDDRTEDWDLAICPQNKAIVPTSKHASIRLSRCSAVWNITPADGSVTRTFLAG